MHSCKKKIEFLETKKKKKIHLLITSDFFCLFEDVPKTFGQEKKSHAIVYHLHLSSPISETFKFPEKLMLYFQVMVLLWKVKLMEFFHVSSEQIIEEYNIVLRVSEFLFDPFRSILYSGARCNQEDWSWGPVQENVPSQEKEICGCCHEANRGTTIYSSMSYEMKVDFVDVLLQLQTMETDNLKADIWHLSLLRGWNFEEQT